VPPPSKPGQNTGTPVTGVSDLWPVFLQMQTYAQLVPQAKTWGTVYNPAEANSMMHIQAMRDAANRLKLKLVEAKVSSSAEVEAAALSLVSQKVQAFTITSDNTTVANLEALVRVAEQHKVPLFAGDVDSVHRGAIAAFGMDYFLVGYAAGKKAALILKGIKPGDIPWGPMEKFSLVINTRAAQAQGLTLSPDQLRRADKVLN
jgi:putative ABC transport system substrate-binding protein